MDEAEREATRYERLNELSVSKETQEQRQTNAKWRRRRFARDVDELPGVELVPDPGTTELLALVLVDPHHELNALHARVPRSELHFAERTLRILVSMVGERVRVVEGREPVGPVLRLDLVEQRVASPVIWLVDERLLSECVAVHV